MIIIEIVTLIAVAAMISVLLGYVLKNKSIRGTTSYCTQDCDQGRHCTCAPSTEQQLKYQLDDEFNGANWPFPVGPKP